MSWSARAALVALVAASVCFGASEARNWRCRSPEFPIAKSVPVCLYTTKVGTEDVKEWVQWAQDLLFSDEEDELLGLSGKDIRDLVEKIVDYVKPGEKVNWQKVNETITRVLRVWCSRADKLGGASEVNEFDDNVVPICHTLIYTVDFKFATLELGVRLLIRGAWGAKGAPADEIKYRDCFSICKLFKEGSTVSIAGLRARPAYFGCWLKEAQNGEEIKDTMFANTLDCGGYNPGGGGDNNNNNNGGGSGSPVGWILVGLVGLALVLLAVGAVAFWFFKLREPPAPATASGLAESFAPSINLSKA